MAKQKLGQNFLHDRNIAGRIAKLVTGQKELIVEIGPGKGIMTEILAGSSSEKIIAVEKDPVLYENLKLKNLNGLEILNGDILETEPAELSGGRKITLIGNIPYYISKEIIDWIIKGNKIIEKGALMVQKEFFQKITSEPGTKIYNAQSVMFRTLFEIGKEFDVGPGAFSPPPKVTSTVFTFTKRGQVPFPGDLESYYRFLKTAFSHRRKTLINNMGKDYDKTIISEFLESNTLPLNIRAEDTGRGIFFNLYRNLH